MELLTTQQIADILQVSYDTALDFVKHSGVPYIMVGKQYRVPQTKFHEFIEAESDSNVNSASLNIYHKSNHTAPQRAKLRRKS